MLHARVHGPAASASEHSSSLFRASCEMGSLKTELCACSCSETSKLKPILSCARVARNTATKEVCILIWSRCDGAVQKSAICICENIYVAHRLQTRFQLHLPLCIPLGLVTTASFVEHHLLSRPNSAKSRKRNVPGELSRDQRTVNTQVQPVFCVLASIPGSGFCGVVDSNKLSSSACSSNHVFPAFEASEVSYLHRWQFAVVELLLYGR